MAREAAMHQRKFVDYREAERHSLGDLMRKYANKVLKDKRSDPPPTWCVSTKSAAIPLRRFPCTCCSPAM